MKRMYLIGAIVVVIVLVFGLVGYIQRPRAVAEKAVQGLANANTAHFAVNLELENAQATQQVLGESGSVGLTVDGAFVRHEQAPADIQAKVGLATKTESVSVNVDGEMRFVNDKAYAYIEKSPTLFQVLNALKGQWVEFARGAQSATAAAPTVTPTVDLKQLFISVKRTGVEDLNGQKVVTYNAVATDQSVIRMMDSIAGVLGTQLTNEQIDNLRTSVSKAGQVPVELKVTRWGTKLKQLSSVLDVPGGNKVRFVLTLKDLNTPVTITAPEGAVSLQAALQKAAQKPTN